jgi:rhodanese-related sulfurtransferase
MATDREGGRVEGRIAQGHAMTVETSIYEATLGEGGQQTPELSTEQMRSIVDDRSAIIVDTRTWAEFEAGHIPGAHHLDTPPEGQVAAVEQLVGGDRGAALVLYCNGPYCKASRRLAEKLRASGFTKVHRYQLGIAIWRALGGPTAIEIGGIMRIIQADRTAVFIDARSPLQFAQGTVPGARNLTTDDLASRASELLPLPKDDFNRRIVLFGSDAAQARELAELLSKRPWHNVAYFPGGYDALAPLTNQE